jgi:stage II sporulation protein R
MNRKSFLAGLAAMILAVSILSGSWALHRQTELASRMLRLHVVANSDRPADQALKLEVRDAVLLRCAAILEGEESLPAARLRLKEAMPELARTGAEVVRSWNRDYQVSVRMEYAPFPRTEYEGFALPAGDYQALRVEIGEARGHNWWCVLYPSLCLAGEEELSQTAMAQGLTEDDVALMEQNQPRYELRWRCVELWEELKAALRDN